LAPNATRNPLVALEDDPLDNAEVWGRMTRVNPGDPPPPPPDPARTVKKKPLQPLEWYYPVTRLKPGAETFLVHPTARTPDPDNNDKDRTTSVKLRKLHGQDGEYVAPLPFNRAGRFKLSVDPKNKSPASMEYRVSLPPDHEQSPGGMAEADMMKLAADSGHP